MAICLVGIMEVGDIEFQLRMAGLVPGQIDITGFGELLGQSVISLEISYGSSCPAFLPDLNKTCSITHSYTVVVW
ncbi:unnamed protein product [Cuscuta campestris]|uniref:Uncharacterized protein n=1 Tax=Cuscuta campestris TaxID=132261 RepID=A0A484LDP6_9ASTE|nr:unnamed protein product [Cuscuta campestris]